MMENTANSSQPIAPLPEGGKSGLGRWMPHLLTAAFVLGVVVIECGAAYMLLPSSDELQDWAQDRYEQPEDPFAETEDFPQEDVAHESDTPTTEVEMGNFSVTAYQPVAGSTLRIDFDLWGTVFEDNLSEFQDRWARNENRIREQVIVTVRGSEVTDLTDAGWGLLKRKILDKTNRMLGRPLLQEIVFSEFAFVEQ